MLTEIFGSYPQIKVINLLISHPYSEYTKKDMAEYAGIARGTLYEFFDKLVEYGLIKPTKKEGNGQFYQSNPDSPAMKAISAFQKILADIEIEKQLAISRNENSKEFMDQNSIMKKIDDIFEKIEINESPNSNKRDHEKEFSDKNKKSLKVNSK